MTANERATRFLNSAGLANDPRYSDLLGDLVWEIEAAEASASLHREQKNEARERRIASLAEAVADLLNSLFGEGFQPTPATRRAAYKVRARLALVLIQRR